MLKKIAILSKTVSLRAQTVLHGVVAPCHQHHHSGSVGDKVPQLHTKQPDPLDWS